MIIDPMLLLAIPLGVFAGFLTTIAGLGGGLVLVAVLSYVWSPHDALAVSSPALAVGNGHRAWIYRRAIHWRQAKPIALGAFCGSLVGGFLAVKVPNVLVAILILVATLIALARTLDLWVWKGVSSARFLFPVSAALGAVSATSGGLRFLLAPLVRTTGLEGDAYLATLAVTAVVMHVAQSSAYGATGMLDRRLLVFAMVMALGILAGNRVGVWGRNHLSPKSIQRVEVTSIVVAALLVVADLAMR